MRLNNPTHVKRLLAQVIKDLKDNDKATNTDIKKANTIGYLANILLKAIEQGELVKRLEELEKRVEEKT